MNQPDGEAATFAWIDAHQEADLNKANGDAWLSFARMLPLRTQPQDAVAIARRGDFRPLAARLRQGDRDAIEFTAGELERGGGVFKARRTNAEAVKLAVELAKKMRAWWAEDFGKPWRGTAKENAETFAARYLDVPPNAVIRRRRKGR